MSSKDSFLVLGANSFSGASFVKFLLDRKINVIATSRSPQPHKALLPYAWGRDLTKIEFHIIDLNHDLEKLRTIIERKTQDMSSISLRNQWLDKVGNFLKTG